MDPGPRALPLRRHAPQLLSSALRLGAWAQRRRWWIALGAAVVLATGDHHAYVFDGWVFTHAGHVLLSSRWASTFADPVVQAGPLQLLLYGALGSRTGSQGTELLSLAVEVGTVAGLMGVTGAALEGRRGREAAQLVIGLAAACGGLAHAVFVNGHPAEAAVPLLWMTAVVLIRRGHPALAGAVLGLAAGWEPWGVLGAPIALLAPGFRAAVTVWAAQVAAVVALFAPFAIFGVVRTFDLRWFVTVQSPLQVFLHVPVGTAVPWTWRLAQGAAALVSGAAAALAFRRSPHAIWLVPGVVVAARLMLDPVNFGYYWLAVIPIGLVAAAEVATAPSVRRRATARIG